MEDWDDILSTMQWPSLLTRIVTPRDTSSLPDDKHDNNVLVTRSPRQQIKPDSIGLVSVSKARFYHLCSKNRAENMSTIGS